MEIRDVIHGSILVHPFELPILDSKYFQRLRQIKQMGFAENSFPSTTHNRYIHSLGAMTTATQAFDRIFHPTDQIHPLSLHADTRTRFRAAVRLAALLHDVGHGPLSHTTEFAMPDVKTLKLPSCIPLKTRPRKATHEDYTLKMILDSGLTSLIEKAGRPFSLKPIHVAGLIESKIEIQDSFFEEGGVNFRPILQQLISSELDADRMDYLRRDSLQAGVSYGQFDFNWLVSNLTSHFQNGKCYLSLQHRALYTFEDFLISRFHMFLMVYFHHKSVIFDEMLGQYFESSDCNYALPSDIEEYCEYNDAHLYSHLSQSTNPWARRIVEKRPYRVLIELHSGIPATKTAKQEQEHLLSQIESDLKKQNLHSLMVTSTGELSKYFRKPVDPIFVRYDNHYSAPSFIPLEQCTDLFQKYGEKRSITRVYIAPESFSLLEHNEINGNPRYPSRNLPFRYQEDESPNSSI
jgi:HD superfamily phosphohydrolase